MILRLLYRESSQLALLKELVLEGIWHAFIKFSDCGTMFTLVVPNDDRNEVPEQVRLIRLNQNSTVHDVLNMMEQK